MNILLGVGNPLLGDDGAGCFVAEKFFKEGWKCYNCETTPENFTGIIRREKPEKVLIIDAADMGINPGELRIIPKARIEDAGIGTHQLPLSHLIIYLESLAEEVIFIGIQIGKPDICGYYYLSGSPVHSENNCLSESYNVAGSCFLSDNVKNGAENLISLLKENELKIRIW